MVDKEFFDRLISFDWNKGNIDKNLRKHKVAVKESEEVFFNKPLSINYDKQHSKKEPRFQAMGQTNKQRKLFISFTIRGQKIRIISSRDQGKEERRKYAKIKTNS